MVPSILMQLQVSAAGLFMYELLLPPYIYNGLIYSEYFSKEKGNKFYENSRWSRILPLLSYTKIEITDLLMT